MALTKKRRNNKSIVNRGASALQETIRHEVIGLFVVGLACLGIVALYAESSGVVGGELKRLLTVLAGDGRVGIPIMVGAWGLAYMNRRIPRLGSRAGGAVLLWLVLLGFFHLQLEGIENLSSADILNEGKLGHGGGLIGAGLTAFFKAMLGMAGSYVMLTLGALLGALLIINRSLIDGVRETKQLGREAGIWLKNQMADFAAVLKSSENEKTKEESCKGEQFGGEQTDFSPERKRDKTKTPVQKQPLTPDQTVVERPLVIKTLDDQEEFAAEYVALEASGAGAKVINTNGMEEKSPAANLEGTKTGKGKSGAGKASVKEQEAKTAFMSPGTVTGTPVSRQTLEGENFQLPPISLLNKALKIKNPRLNKDLADNVKILEDTLASFGVRIKVTQVTQGPAITRYEAQPAPGVKVSKITNLADDIALSLASADVRIEAPIPGKSVVGIEVPNKEIAMVHFREVLETPEFQETTSKLAVCIGKDITGTPVVADLAKMPHLLIAGATGSGKSVCINTLINSILFKARPDEVKFLMVDPKMVELSNYNGIPHLIAPVVTDPKKAAGALKWIVTEMETRYELFAAAGVRDIIRYNFLRSQEEGEDRPTLPYVVVIIDELADLMMVAPGEVEDAICRLAQMARAAGIHLLVATQRPSVDVITGIIKANIPSRIAFGVSSQTDSRTILDMNGAEKLLGRGDMLFYPMGASKPLRIQGCYLGDKEVENVVTFLQNQAKPEYREIPHLDVGNRKSEEMEDELFYQASQLFMEGGNASVSLLQRRLRIGYTRAARLMDLLEEKGVVGSFEGSKPREVLMTRGQFELKFGQFNDNLKQ